MPKGKTFFDEMRSFLIVFVIFGLWPSWENAKFKYLLLFLSFISLLQVFTIFVSAIFINDVLEDTTLSTAVASSFLISLIVTHLIVVLQAFFNRNAQMQLITKFSNVDRLFGNKLQMYISYHREKRGIYLRLLALMASLVGIKVFLIIHLHRRNRLSNFWYHCFYSVLLLRIRCIQVIFFAILLRARVALVNEKLKEIIVCNNLRDDNAMEWRPIVEMKSILFVLDHSYARHSMYDRLLYLKQIYSELYEICELINTAFGWSLLALITQSFIDFTSNSYWTFLALEQPHPDISEAMDCLSLLIPTVIVLSVMAFYCSSCTSYARSMGSYLHRITKQKENEAQNDLIREFSLQVIHEPIFITANGFFNINFDLLGSMAAATVTYLVILIQFELSDKEIQKMTASNRTV